MLSLAEAKSIVPGITGKTKDRPASYRNAGPRLRDLEAGSVAAKALYDVWSGNPLVIIDSPPGAGKTETIATIVSHLVMHSNPPLRIGVVAGTKNQIVGIANRLTNHLSTDFIHLFMSGDVPGDIDPMIPVFSSKGTVYDLEVERMGNDIDRCVKLRTLASVSKSKDEFDILVVDEAYQATCYSVLLASRKTEQLLLVGDPGQIGPVQPIDDRHWSDRDMNVSDRAPTQMKRRPEAIVHHLRNSYRLGSDTVDCIRPLYGFSFDSANVDREVIGKAEIEAIEVPEAETLTDPILMSKVASHAASLIGSVIRDEDDERPATTDDIAIVVPQNDQITALSSYLSKLKIRRITIGTANSLQGGEWPIVIAVDPILGGEVSEHAIEPGRLCVMASRHSHHLSWFHDGTWEAALTEEQERLTDRDRDLLIEVRRRLCAHP